MTAKRRGLGRGLDVLLGGAKLENETEKLRTLSIDQLRPSRFQPRKDIDPARLQELADSISAQGVVQPVVVRPMGDSQYEIIAGERRWRAAQLAGLHDLPVVVREVTDQTALAIALIENIQREDLNPLEEAEALKRLLEEFEMTHQQVADAVGKSRATVSNLLRLNELHPDAKHLLLTGAIEMGHARAILALEFQLQAEIARKVASAKLSVRATELLIQKLRDGQKARKPEMKDPDIRRLEERIATRIGAPVLIKHGKKGAGQLVIHYDSLDQLEGVLDRLK
ncbi:MULTISPECIES: ParB/RepB/Spo0J family partition protein [Methylocaldum]|jgi:ParB family chromosome partitioning protein|uniref:ParB/RepB/Spo0J family partition protein n=1 Tax=unclassified Methylocaldum TaxID=2622260 RepID=UPI00098B6715|nr:MULTISPECIES: ParB/RepB/Spo0J family partition protein [unclassified Methylocaldum]MBP1149262.1 ParB family chromosome partitioning protein [Methylocaldum sp. RMAD-M]